MSFASHFLPLGRAGCTVKAAPIWVDNAEPVNCPLACAYKGCTASGQVHCPDGSNTTGVNSAKITAQLGGNWCYDNANQTLTCNANGPVSVCQAWTYYSDGNCQTPVNGCGLTPLIIETYTNQCTFNGN